MLTCLVCIAQPVEQLLAVALSVDDDDDDDDDDDENTYIAHLTINCL